MKKLNLYEAIQKLKSMPYEEWVTVLNNLLSNKADSRIPLENEKHIFYIIDYIKNARIYEPELDEIIEKSCQEYKAFEMNKEIENLSKQLLDDEEQMIRIYNDKEILDKKIRAESIVRIFVSGVTAFLTAILTSIIWNLLFK